MKSRLGPILGTWTRRRLSSLPAIHTHVNQIKKCLTDPSRISYCDANEPYLSDWTKNYSVKEAIVVKPISTEEVSAVMRYAHDHYIQVVPQGGNTGLVGGSVPRTSGCIIISMEKMNQIVDIDKINSVVTLEAGVVLEHLDNILKQDDTGLMMPIDLGAKGSCQIGGNISTNAGGLNVVKYGGIKNYLLGLEVVKGDGTVLNMMRRLQKDNTGLHLPLLFVGSEGNIGIITKCIIKCVPRPVYKQSLVLTINAYDQLPTVLMAAKRIMSDALSAFEFIDATSLSLLKEGMPGLIEHVGPLNELASSIDVPTSSEEAVGISGKVAILLECTGNDENYLSQMCEEMIESASTSVDLEADNCFLPSSETQNRALWNIRENVPVCLFQLSRSSTTGSGRLFKYDVSLRVESFDSFVADVRSALMSKGYVDTSTFSLQVSCFGHAGDGNLHLNVLTRQSDTAPVNFEMLQSHLDEIVYGLIMKRYNGSISAEHGVGQMKSDYMPLIRSQEELSFMKHIKTFMDPKSILPRYY